MHYGMEQDKILQTWSGAPEISLNDLPKFSQWPARIMGISSWSRAERTAEDVEREYEREKFYPLHQYLLNNPEVKDYSLLERVLLPKDYNMVCAMKSILKKLSAEDAYKLDTALVAKHLTKYAPASALVDIGAGSGRTIMGLGEYKVFSKMHLFALERMPSACKIISIMSSRQGRQVIVGKCNLTQSPLTQISIPEGAIFFTNGVVSTIHRETIEIVRSIIDLKPKIVMHLEPFASACDKSTLYGQMCLAYLQLNKYNSSFDYTLRELDGTLIEIVDEEANVFGNNPFFPKSMLAWKPKF